MKMLAKILGLTIAATVCLTVDQTVNAQSPEVIAYWAFNDDYDFRDDDEEDLTPTQITRPARLGSGTLYQQRGEIDGNGKGGNAFTDALLGIDTSGDAEEQSLAWDDFATSGDNDGELFLAFSTAGYGNIQISMDVEGDEFAAFDLKYDTNPLEDVDFIVDTGAGPLTTTIKDFASGNSTDFLNNNPVSAVIGEFTRIAIDLGAVTNANDQANFVVRLDDFDGNQDVRFDNILITGTPVTATIPEPSSVSLLMLASTSMLARRRTIG